MPEKSEHEDDGATAPSLRQRFHSATGDRDAEARTLAEEADIPEDEADHAVREAAGDEEAPAAKGDIARPGDSGRPRKDGRR
jgi:hypothetical protein